MRDKRSAYGHDRQQEEGSIETRRNAHVIQIIAPLRIQVFPADTSSRREGRVKQGEELLEKDKALV